MTRIQSVPGLRRRDEQRSEFVSVEALEARALMSGYSNLSAIDAFHLERLIRDVGAPDGASGTNFGAVVTSIGDIDADGRTDFAIGAPGSLGENGRWAGAAGNVFIYSGASLSLIRTLNDGAAGFGSAMVSLGDVNADGVPDLAVGSPSADINVDAAIDYFGRVRVYSGADGSVIWTRLGGSRFDELGWALAAAGDVDNDGRMDLIIGAPGGGADMAAPLPGAGSVHIVSGIDGASIVSFDGEADGDRFGHAVDGGVDAPMADGSEGDGFDDGDGFFDMMVGAPGRAEGAGRAYVYSGADWTVRFMIDGQAGDESGASVAFLGLRDEGLAFSLRYAVGSPGRDTDTGTVRLFHASGLEDPFGALGDLEAGARFGSRISRLDVRSASTGMPYFTVTAPASATGRTLFVHVENSFGGDFTGAAAANASWLQAVGDIDGDGILDFIAGGARDLGAPGEGTVRAMPYALALGSGLAPSVVAASDNGMNFVLRAAFGETPGFDGIDGQGYVVFNGELIPMTLFAGLSEGSRLIGVNNAGLFVAQVDSTNTRPESYFFLFNGQTTPLLDAIRRYEGELPTNLYFKELNDNGDVIFNGTIADNASASFLFRAGVLKTYTNMFIADANEAGQILLFDRQSGSNFVENGDGSRVEVVGFRPSAAAFKINDDGSVIGAVATDEREELGLWRDGVVTLVTEDVPTPDGVVGQPYWAVFDYAQSGRIIASLSWAVNPGSPHPTFVSNYYLSTPQDGWRLLSDVTEPPLHQLFTQSFENVRLLSSGVIRADGALLIPVDDAGPPVTGGASLTSAMAGGSGLFVTAINQAGEAILLRRDGVRFTGDALNVNVLLGSVDSVVTYVDSRDGLTYAMVKTSLDRLVWFRQQSDGLFGEGVVLEINGATPIAGELSAFTSVDGRVHIAGVSEDGDVLIYYQTNQAEPEDAGNWGFNNLTQEHLASQSRPLPAFDAETVLVGYVTPWGGMNLAAINPAGNIEVVWWAPGKVYWDYDNLSAEASTPPLQQGRLAAYVAPWGGLHLAAVDEAGHLQSTWWAPGATAWSHNDLTLEFNGPMLAPESLTAYVTSWSGLNIAGINSETGEAAVYWWTPATNGWITETLNVGEGAPSLTGRLVSAVRGDNLNIFASAEDGRLLRLYWYPSQGGMWVVEGVEASMA